MKSRQGIGGGDNAQAMVSPLNEGAAGRTGLLVTAAEVVTAPDDHGQLLPMCEAAEALTGQRADVTLADGGYYSGPNLVACAEREQTIVVPEARTGAYNKNAFTYDAETDSYACPQGQVLHLVGSKRRTRGRATRVYRGAAAVCRACPAFGRCTTDRRHGRMLEGGPEEAHLQRHRRWLAPEAARVAYRQRKQVVEPSFGILKEQQGARRFLLRGLM